MSPRLLLLAARVAAEFQAIDFLPDTVPCDAKLTTSVPATCVGSVAKDQTYDVWKTSMNFRFGRLEESQWQTLKKQYTAPWAGPMIASGKTPLFDVYDATRDYTLMDFLPVQVRGLCGHNFAEEDEALPAGEPMPSASAPSLFNKSILVPNCWATVYEFLRTAVKNKNDDTEVFQDIYSTDDKDAQAWLRAETSLLPGPYTSTNKKFGDIMFIFLRDKQMIRPILQHAVVFVDEDIVFEKAGSGNKNPFRLTDIETVEKEWMPTTKGGMFTWEVHRPRLGRTQGWSFAERFSLHALKPDRRWPQFWQWPKSLQEEYTLGVADNPRQAGSIDGLTLLKARRYRFKKDKSGRWEPQRMKSEEELDTLVV